MADPIADDFAAIAARMHEIAAEAKPFSPDDGEEYCPHCKNGGWICYSSPSGRGPLFRECEHCYNPKDYPRP